MIISYHVYTYPRTHPVFLHVYILDTYSPRFAWGGRPHRNFFRPVIVFLTVFSNVASQTDGTWHECLYHAWSCSSDDVGADETNPAVAGLCCAKSCHVEPSWAHVRPMLGYVGPILGPSWAHLGSLLGPCCAYVDLCWAYVGLSWPMLRLCWAYVGLCWA